jgi:hypothetical protein
MPPNSIYTFETWGSQVLDFLSDVVKDRAFLICNSVGGKKKIPRFWVKLFRFFLLQSIIQCVLCARQWIVCGFRYCWLGSRPPGSREGAGSDVDQCVVADAAHQEAAVVRASVCESTPECFTVSNLSARLYALLQLSRLPFQGGRHSPE